MWSFFTSLKLGLGLLTLACVTGCSVPNPTILRTSYPVIKYRGKGAPPTVQFQKSAPAGWAYLSSVSKAAVGAIIVSEDWAFYQHKGYDPNQIREAIETDLERGRFARGASTITQQVAKNVFLSAEKTLLRKFKELILAVRMENVLKKNKILEVYLNIAEWGEGLYGIRAASRHYFNKSPSELTAKEGAFLAMLLPSPKRYSQSFRDRKLTAYAERAVNSILEKMLQAGHIDDGTYYEARETPLSFEESALQNSDPDEGFALDQ